MHLEIVRIGRVAEYLLASSLVAGQAPYSPTKLTRAHVDTCHRTGAAKPY
jgi:hypothetical protein